MKRVGILLLVLLFALTGCSGSWGSQAPPEAGEGSPVPEEIASAPVLEGESQGDSKEFSWEIGEPQRHGMNPQVLSRMHEALEESQVYAMVTVKDGVIVDEYYREGYDENSVFPLHSCSKSFTSALVGIALEKGELGSVDDELSKYLPEVLDDPDTEKGRITLRHLLTHTSGLEWYEWGGGYSNWNEFRSAGNWVDYILGRRLVSSPGTAFNYSTGNTHLLAAALQRATGMTEFEYAEENLFEPLGIESAGWGADAQGVTDGGNGITMTARDAARFGQLYLQGGTWQGEQIIPEDWVEQSTSAQNHGAGEGTGSYGFQWWTRSFSTAGYDTYYAFGAHGQFIFVVPQLDLVTVITSNSVENSYAPRPFFTDYVLAACGQ